MGKQRIYYREGYKYQLAENYKIVIPVYPPENIDIDFISLNTCGVLIVRAGYAWDGASGPTLDTRSTIRGSLIHDALYQLMRQMLLPHAWRSKCDDILFDLCVEDGMFRWRAWLWRKMVGQFADPASRHQNDNPLLVAP